MTRYFIIGGDTKKFSGRLIPIEKIKKGDRFPIYLQYDYVLDKWIATTGEINGEVIGIVQDIDYHLIKPINLEEKISLDNFCKNACFENYIPFDAIPATLIGEAINELELNSIMGSERYLVGMFNCEEFLSI